jgi:hypothetical protein
MAQHVIFRTFHPWRPRARVSVTAIALSALTSAATTAAVQAVAFDASRPAVIAYSVAAGIFGAGVSWATLRGKVIKAADDAAIANTRITTERTERIAEIKELRTELKEDFRHEFKTMRVEQDNRLSRQTQEIIAAVKDAGK